MNNIHFDSKDTAQRCKKTGKIIPMIRCGCPCGCTPDKGFLKIDMSNINELTTARYSGTTQKFYRSVWIDATDDEIRLANELTMKKIHAALRLSRVRRSTEKLI